MCKSHVTSSKVKVTETCLCLAYIFVLYCGISRVFGINDHPDKTMCHVQEPYHWLEGQGQTIL